MGGVTANTLHVVQVSAASRNSGMIRYYYKPATWSTKRPVEDERANRILARAKSNFIVYPNWRRAQHLNYVSKIDNRSEQVVRMANLQVKKFLTCQLDK